MDSSEFILQDLEWEGVKLTKVPRGPGEPIGPVNPNGPC